MRNDAAHKEWWQIFEVVFGIPLLVAIVMQFIEPFSLPRGRLTLVFVSIGIALMILGTILAAMARREFRRYGQPTDPGHPTRKIVITGVFSVSRNPLYLGGIGTIYGPALGAVFLKLLPEVTLEFQDYEMLMNGVILIIILVFVPRGLFGIVTEIKNRLLMRGAE